jgi:hypothetical protein
MGKSKRWRMGLLALASVLLMACQTTPLAPQQQLQLGLGVSKTAQVTHAQTLLQQALDGFTQAQDVQGQAKTAFALGELYKSTRWQETLQPPATLESYQKSSDYFEQAALLYTQLGQPLVAGSAYVGAANAALLADRLPQACDYHRQALQLAQEFDADQDGDAKAQLQKNLTFFADLTVVCLAQSSSPD